MASVNMKNILYSSIYKVLNYQWEYNMKNKICIITGATGGIGYYLSLGFLEKGYKTVALDIEKLKNTPRRHCKYRSFPSRWRERFYECS